VLEAAEPEQVFRRLDAHAHLVAVVGAGVREPVDDRADRRAEDQVALGDFLGTREVWLETVDGVLHARHRRLNGVTDDALPELRASDADRERTAELLRRAAGEGRLTIDELDERLDVVYATRTQRELDKLTADVVVLDDPARANRMPVRTGEGSNWVVSVMSGHDRKGRWRVGRHLKVISVMGGSSIDLNDAELTSDVTEITVFSLMGGSDVRVPDGLNVEISDFAFMGGNDAKIGEYMPDPGGPLVKIRMISIMGGSEVQRGRKLSRAERRALKHSPH